MTKKHFCQGIMFNASIFLMAQLSSKLLTFHKHDTIGFNDAADDKEFLLNCFVDQGLLRVIEDFTAAKCILLGRTGAGKTALVTKLKADKSERVISINPESIAMNHISNSTIIQYLVELGIDLNTFFKLLWRHEICVEIFNTHVKANSETDYREFVDRVRYQFKKRNPRHVKALDYLEQWKDTFWKTSESHITEMVSKTESEVGGVIGASANSLTAKIKGGARLSEQEVTEIKQRGQEIVDNVQMREVTQLLEMLDDFVEFHQMQYYVVLDQLDEKWVNNGIRYKLIKSLIETARDLNRLSNIKPVVVLRQDLLSRVFDLTQDTGFQEEKYSPLYLRMSWNRAQLEDLINKRINHLMYARYAKRKRLTHRDVFPATIKGISTIDYLLDRTQMRPRDIIEFVNEIIEEVTTKEDGLISEESILSTEVSYSRDRLRSLGFEWFADYPGIIRWTSLLRKKTGQIYVSDIDDKQVDEMSNEYAGSPAKKDFETTDIIHELCLRKQQGGISLVDLKAEIVHIFYKIGLVGLKTEFDKSVCWADLSKSNLSVIDIEPETQLTIHPAYRSALAVR